MPSSFEFRVPEKLPMPSLATRPVDTGAGLEAKADKTITITGSGLATGGGSLAADRVITVPKASPAEAAAGTNDTKAVTPLALANPIGSLDTRLDAVELAIALAAENLTPDIAPDNSVGGVSDFQGNYPIVFRPDGTTVLHTMEVVGIASMVRYGSFNGTNTDNYPYGYAWGIVDEFGNLAIALKDDGTFAAVALEQVATINGIPISAYLSGGGGATTPIGSFTADINHIVGYGQSRGTGADSIPAISTTQPYDSLMFVGGVRPVDGGSAPAIYASLVPLVELTLSVPSPFGETPMSGMMECIKELVAAENLVVYTDHSYQMLASVEAVNGTVIDQLDVGSGAYQTVKDAISAGYARAQALGKSYKWRGFTWSQGESDYLANTPGATYQSKLIALRSDFDAYAKSVSGQTENGICFVDQLRGHVTYSHPNDPYIALIQLQVCLDSPDFIMSTPTYHLGDTGHHTNTQSKILGAYHGIAYKRTIVDGVKWEPVRPISVYRQGTVLTVRFNVPTGELVFDTTALTSVVNSGFTLVTSANAPITISSVTITERDTIRIVATTAPAAGAKLRYGFPGHGNLRDTQGDTIIFDGGGLNTPMHNWCVIFEEILV